MPRLGLLRSLIFSNDGRSSQHGPPRFKNGVSIGNC
jgi:hypothetical protein